MLASQLWTKLLTTCGDSHYLYLPARKGFSHRPQQWQYRDSEFEVVPRALSSAKRLNGIQWEGVAVMSASAFRSRTAQSKPGSAEDSADPETWGDWNNWGDGLVPSRAFALDMRPDFGDPPNVIWMKKEKGKWLFWSAWPGASGYRDSLSGFDEIERRKPSCADVADKPAAK